MAAGNVTGRQATYQMTTDRRIRLGYCVRRTVKNPDHWRGKAVRANLHTVYTTYDEAAAAIPGMAADDDRFDYDVAEVWHYR